MPELVWTSLWNDARKKGLNSTIQETREMSKMGDRILIKGMRHLSILFFICSYQIFSNIGFQETRSGYWTWNGIISKIGYLTSNRLHVSL